MPNKTKENNAVLIGCLRDTTYYNFHLDSQVKGLLTLVELLLYSNPPNGFIFIVSLKGVRSNISLLLFELNGLEF